MPKDVTRTSVLSAELSAYTATFSNRSMTLAGELRSNGEYAVTAIRTAGGALVGVTHDTTVKAAVNALCGQLGIAGGPTFP